MGTIRTKRAYESPSEDDGKRFLVDRLWPRGVKKASLRIDGWLKEIAPSDALRRWFHHDPDKWAEFQRRYRAELKEKPELCRPLLAAAATEDVTLLAGASDVEHNNAVALKNFLEERRERRAGLK